MTKRSRGWRTMRGVQTGLAAAAMVLLAGCGESGDAPVESAPSPAQSQPPEESGPLTAEELHEALGDETGELCQFPASRTADIERFNGPGAISSVSSYGEWENAYAERYGGCIIFSWDEGVDANFLPSMRETLSGQVADEYVYALAAEDERWMLTLRSESSLDYDQWVADGQRIAELLGRGEPVSPSS